MTALEMEDLGANMEIATQMTATVGVMEIEDIQIVSQMNFSGKSLLIKVIS